MIKFWKKVLILAQLQQCQTVILHLNDSEYDRMPPLFALENYDSCLVQDGTYCLVTLELLGEPNNQLMEMIREYSKHKTKHFNYSHVQRGICLTKICKKHSKLNENKDVKQILSTCLNGTMMQEYGLQVKVSHIHYCDQDRNKKEIDVLDWIVAAAFVFIIMINVIGSFYDIYCRNVIDDNGNQYLLCFSILKNWEWLISSPKIEDPKLEKLQGFHGPKSICTFFVVFAHVATFFSGRFIDNPHDFEKAYDEKSYYIIINGQTMVQVFFTISGFLLIYNLQLYAEKNKITWSLMPKIMFYRWWRLTPANAVMLAFTVTWLRHLGSGPLWNLEVGEAVTECRRYWWHHLLYFNNYVTEDRLCAIQSWHLAVDSQLFYTGLVIYISALCRGRTWPLLLLLLLGVLSPALQVWLQDLDMAFASPEYQRYLMKFSEYHHNVALKGHNNLSSYTVGMAVGYFGYQWQKKGVDLSKFKIITYLLWAAIPSIVWFFTVGEIFYADDGPPTLTTRLLYAATCRLVIGCITGFIFLAVGLRPIDRFSRVMMWSGWTIPSRLSYCVYLNHIVVILVLAGTKTQLGRFHFLNLLITHLGVYTLSYVLALPLFLLVESPMNRLFKMLTLTTPEKYSKKID